MVGFDSAGLVSKRLKLIGMTERDGEFSVTILAASLSETPGRGFRVTGRGNIDAGSFDTQSLS